MCKIDIEREHRMSIGNSFKKLRFKRKCVCRYVLILAYNNVCFTYRLAFDL